MKKANGWADAWRRDLIESMHSRVFVVSREIDVRNVREIIERHKERGNRVTYTQIFVQGCALVLARRPEWRAGGVSRGGPVDVAVSMGGDRFLTPHLVVRGADQKSLLEISRDMERLAPAARERFEKDYRVFNRWGWLLPFGWLRRFYLRWSLARTTSVKRIVGDIQITGISTVDLFVPFQFISPAILGIGAVRERPVVEEGQIVVRPTVFVSCCADHRVWNGSQAASFLVDFQDVLASLK